MKISNTDVVESGRNAINGLVRARIWDTESKPNDKGYQMTRLKCEIIEPETMVDPDTGKDMTIAGRKFDIWLLHNPAETWGQSRVLEFCQKLNIDTGDTYDTDLHKEMFLGMEFDISVTSEEDFKRFPKKPGQKLGDIMKDGQGKNITNGFRINASVDAVPPLCNPVKNEAIAF